jgi:hypothetical protein
MGDCVCTYLRFSGTGQDRSLESTALDLVDVELQHGGFVRVHPGLSSKFLRVGDHFRDLWGQTGRYNRLKALLFLLREPLFLGLDLLLPDRRDIVSNGKKREFKREY